MPPTWRLLLAFACISGLSRAADAPGPMDLKPLAEVRRFAETHGLPTDGLIVADATGNSRPGDRLTVLFEVQDGGSKRQWLAEFRAAALTASEARSKPGSGLGLPGVFQTTLHTDTGNVHRFEQNPAALEVRTIGPFPAAGLFALVQFGNLAFRTDGIDAITRGMMDTPGPFTATFINLDWPAMRLEDTTACGIPGGRIFRVPYTLHSKTTARGVLLIAESDPPLHNMAGIIGATIDETSKAPGRRLVMRVLAGRRDER